MRDVIVKILLDFVKKHHICHTSEVILELFADELIRNGLVMTTQCEDCRHRTDDGFCLVDVEGVGYKKTHEGGYCDRADNR